MAERMRDISRTFYDAIDAYIERQMRRLSIPGIILIPSILMYVVEAYGWKITLGPSAREVPFWRVLAIRTAGEVVNMTTPTAYVGGEPLKAYLLQKHRVPMVEGLASVVIAKTTMTIAQVLFILLGMAAGFWILGANGSSGQIAAAG